MKWSDYILEVRKREREPYELVNSLIESLYGGSVEINVPVTRCLHATIGLTTEIGECFEAWTIAAADNLGRYDRKNLEEEIGDIFWYTGLLLDAAGFPLKDLQEFDDSYLEDFLPAWNNLRTDLALQYVLINCTKLLDIAKKYFVYGKKDVFIGDALAGLTEAHIHNLYLLCASLNLNPEELRQMNCNKLQARYGDGFSNDAALNRNVEAERAAMLDDIDEAKEMTEYHNVN
ncbi:MAG TPA: hypothetical protein VKR58_06180 [Aquella sp.]|nr:hypothetical protein [Aquella sp.]